MDGARILVIGGGVNRSAVSRWLARICIFAGLLLLVMLVIMVAPQWFFSFPLSAGLYDAFNLALFFIPAITLVIAALLLSIGWRLVQEGQIQSAGEGVTLHTRRWSPGGPTSRTIAAVFSLSALLLGMVLYNLYWLAIWDSTDDSLDFIWLILPVLATVFAGVLLAALLPWKAKWAGFCYALLTPALMIGIFYIAKQVD